MVQRTLLYRREGVLIMSAYVLEDLIVNMGGWLGGWVGGQG